MLYILVTVGLGKHSHLSLQQLFVGGQACFVWLEFLSRDLICLSVMQLLTT